VPLLEVSIGGGFSRRFSPIGTGQLPVTTAGALAEFGRLPPPEPAPERVPDAGSQCAIAGSPGVVGRSNTSTIALHATIARMTTPNTIHKLFHQGKRAFGSGISVSIGAALGSDSVVTQRVYTQDGRAA